MYSVTNARAVTEPKKQFCLASVVFLNVYLLTYLLTYLPTDYAFGTSAIHVSLSGALCFDLVRPDVCPVPTSAHPAGEPGWP